MRLVAKINERISIYADENQFVVKVRSKPNQEGSINKRVGISLL
jgi:hypothetical protein